MPLRNLFSAAALVIAMATSPSPVAAAAIRFEATGAAPGTAILEIQTEELVTMTTLPFRLVLSDEAGRSVTGARVSCELSMPSMTMPENRPKITERDGAYAGEMILTCAMGDWRMTCLAEGERGLHRAMSFDLGRARLK